MTVIKVIAFIILVIVFWIIFKVILFVTKLFEKLLKFTVILGVPSKILGALVGIIEYYIIAFIVLFCLNQPTFTSINLKDSSIGMFILHKTPVLNRVIDNTLNAVDEIYSITESYDDKDSNTGLNEETLDILFAEKGKLSKFEFALLDLAKILASVVIVYVSFVVSLNFNISFSILLTFATKSYIDLLYPS